MEVVKDNSSGDAKENASRPASGLETTNTAAATTTTTSQSPGQGGFGLLTLPIRTRTMAGHQQQQPMRGQKRGRSGSPASPSPDRGRGRGRGRRKHRRVEGTRKDKEGEKKQQQQQQQKQQKEKTRMKKRGKRESYRKMIRARARMPIIPSSNDSQTSSQAQEQAPAPEPEQPHVALLTEKTWYVFKNEDLARAALGIGAEGAEQQQQQPDRRSRQGMAVSCQNLAVIGELALELALAEKWFQIGEIPMTWNVVRDTFTSNAALKSFCVKSELFQCYEYEGPHSTLPPAGSSASASSQATLVKAVIGAINLDSDNSLGAVQAALERLGIMSDVRQLLKGLQQAMPTLSNESNAPGVVSLADLLASEPVKKVLESINADNSEPTTTKSQSESNQTEKIAMETSDCERELV